MAFDCKSLSHITRCRAICQNCPHFTDLREHKDGLRRVVDCRQSPAPLILGESACPMGLHDGIKAVENPHEFLRTFFQHVVMLNLDRRPDRLAEMEQEFTKEKWPFVPYTRISAVDGQTQSVPAYYKAGGGAWGCLQSHIRIVEQAAAENWQNVLILEDDAAMTPEFHVGILNFLSAVPADWDCLMLGGQHQRAPRQMGDADMVRCLATHRTHAYAISRKFFSPLLAAYRAATGHCDATLGGLHAQYKTYAPRTFLMAQRANKSDIANRWFKTRIWSSNPVRMTYIAMFDNMNHITALKMREHGFVAWRNPMELGFDRDIHAILTRPPHNRVKGYIPQLRDWISRMRFSVMREDEQKIITLWHPMLSIPMVQRAVGKNLIVLSGDDVETLLHKWLAAENTTTDNRATVQICRLDPVDTILCLRAMRNMPGGDLIITNHTGEQQNFMAPLLDMQYYIKSTRYSPHMEGRSFFDQADRFVHAGISRPATYCAAIGASLADDSPWIDLPTVVSIGTVLFDTNSDMADRFPWHEFQTAYPHAIMIGSPEDHQNLSARGFNFPYRRPRHALELCEWLSGADFFVGPTGIPWALAEGLKMNMVHYVADPRYNWSRSGARRMTADGDIPEFPALKRKI